MSTSVFRQVLPTSPSSVNGVGRDEVLGRHLKGCSSHTAYEYLLKHFLWWLIIEKVAQLCLTLCSPTNYTAHGILQAKILEWVAIPFSRGFSQPRDETQVSCIAGRFFTTWATREAPLVSERWSVSPRFPFSFQLEHPTFSQFRYADSERMFWTFIVFLIFSFPNFSFFLL